MKLNIEKHIDSELLFADVHVDILQEELTEIRRKGIENICISSFHGWKANTPINFLEANKWIKGIWIIDQEVDITPINNLSELKFLSFNYTKETKGKIDFNNFSNLEYLSIIAYNPKKMYNIGSLTKLIDFHCSRWNESDLETISKNMQIRKLTLDYCKLENLKGVDRLNNLKRLDIYSAPNLKDINDLGLIKNSITNLSFELCPKIEDFSVLSSLQNLETFVIQKSTPMQSVQFIKNLKNLRYAYIGTEVLDGNIEILKEKKIEYKKVKKYEEK